MKTKRELKIHAWGANIVLPAGTEVIEVKSGMGPMYAVKDVALLGKLTGNTHDPVCRYTFIDPWEVEEDGFERRSRMLAEQMDITERRHGRVR